jgi:uncharacterized protein (UPF0179 family)
MEKLYIKIPGNCKDCTLYRECIANKEGIKLFVNKLKLNCEDGKILTVKERG